MLETADRFLYAGVYSIVIYTCACRRILIGQNDKQKKKSFRTRTNRHCHSRRWTCRFTSCTSSFSYKKKIIVFDDPESPRNAASYGIHNFLGLDGLLPIKIREIAWEQIDKYDSVEFRNRNIVDVNKEEEYEDGIFVITDDNETSIKAKKVVLAVGCRGCISRYPWIYRMLGRYNYFMPIL